jgi:hypothetical protein
LLYQFEAIGELGFMRFFEILPANRNSTKKFFYIDGGSDWTGKRFFGDYLTVPIVLAALPRIVGRGIVCT